MNTNTIANQCGLTREVLMIAHSKEEASYKIQIRITQGSRSEMKYYFLPEGYGAENAQEYALELATINFLDINAAQVNAAPKPVQGEQHVEENPKQEVGKQESTGEESGKQKASRKSKKSSEEKVTTASSPAQEEMIEVESPFKETPVEPTVESPKKEKADKASKSSAEPYNREDAGSRASFAVYATKLHNGSKEWKTREDLKEISTKLNGVPFIEKDGSIHPDFEAKCKELFGLDEAAL